MLRLKLNLWRTVCVSCVAVISFADLSHDMFGQQESLSVWFWDDIDTHGCWLRSCCVYAWLGQWFELEELRFREAGATRALPAAVRRILGFFGIHSEAPNLEILTIRIAQVAPHPNLPNLKDFSKKTIQNADTLDNLLKKHIKTHKFFDLQVTCMSVLNRFFHKFAYVSSVFVIFCKNQWKRKGIRHFCKIVTVS